MIPITQLVFLGVADSVNPCSLGILGLILMSLIASNPKKIINILLAGLAFTTSVYFMYLAYGIGLVKFFKIVSLLTQISLYLHIALGVGAIIIGIWDLKNYMKGEHSCPVIPKIGDRLSRITKPSSAFIIGAFCSIFLLPCSIGPYVIFSGMISTSEWLVVLPMLLLYNIIFVAPMIIVTVLIYLGFSKIDDIVEWQIKNMKWLTLIAGLLMIAVGIAMFIGPMKRFGLI